LKIRVGFYESYKMEEVFFIVEAHTFWKLGHDFSGKKGKAREPVLFWNA
jgi:hypothetical protein